MKELSFHFILYFVGFALDTYRAVQHSFNGHYWWCVFTIVPVILPAFITTCSEVIDYWKESQQQECNNRTNHQHHHVPWYIWLWRGTCTFIILLIGLITRYKYIIK